MNYNLKGMFTPQPKIYNEENEENEELELLNVSSSSSSSIIPPDEPLLSDKKRLKKQDSKRSLLKSQKGRKSKSRLSSLTNIFKDIFVYGIESQKQIPNYPVINFN